MAENDLQLPPEATDAGALARLLLLETRAPHEPDYDRAESVSAMRLMRRVIENRLATPNRYLARGAQSERDILRLGNQFAGFRDYPSLPAGLKQKLDDILHAATRDAEVAAFVSDAMEVATDASSIPAYLHVTAWRSTGHAGPGAGFRFAISLQGNDFYETDPVPPVIAHHRQGGPYRPHHAHKHR